MNILLEYLYAAVFPVMGFGIALVVIGASSETAKRSPAKRRAGEGKATKSDALFLSLLSPEFGGDAALITSDYEHMGIYATLALSQVGASDDAKAHVKVNFEQYPKLPATYLVAARYAALTGEQQQARDYLATGKTMLENRKLSNDLLVLEPSVIAELIESDPTPIQNSTTIGIILDEIKSNPLKLMLIRVRRTIWVGFGLIFLGPILLVIHDFLS